MKLRNSVNGNTPFEGDRTFRWQAIPANAKILKAIAVVTPVGGVDGAFVEVLGFKPGGANFGATKSQSTLPSTNLAWVEVDFHHRRTLAGVSGSFTGATLQVDVGGGTYAEINKAGAFKTPSDPSDFSVTGPTASLPGLSVAKLKLTHVGTSTVPTPPDLTTVRIRSTPSNVSVRVGEFAPFFTHVGEMTLPETTPDFAPVLQAVLTTAKVENGFCDLPITVHSDTIARLKIDLEVEFLAQQDVLPKDVPEIALPFDFSTLSTSKTRELTIEVPANSRVVPGETKATVRGAFAETRVAFGPTGQDKPAAAVEVSPRNSPAQILVLEKEISAVAIDLLLESLTPSARLQIDIRADFDGKPDQVPLLPTPVELRIDQQAQQGASWYSAQLPAEFLFARATEKTSRYWLLVQSLEGRAAWSIIKADQTRTGAINLQATRDGGLSWQDAVPRSQSLRDENATPPFAGVLRLRDKPKSFKMPIELQVGGEGKEVRKKLDRFEPLGRVDFALDKELAAALNEYLDKIRTSEPETQHLVNADLERWTKVGDQMIARKAKKFDVEINGVSFTPDGRIAYVLDQTLKRGLLLAVDVDCNEEIKEKKIALGINHPRAFVIHPDGTRAYITDGRKLQAVSLETSDALNEPIEMVPSIEASLRTLTLSADGGRLYLVNLIAGEDGNRVQIVDTAKLEQQLPKSQIVVVTKDLDDGSIGQVNSPAAVRLSPDESLMYLLLNIHTADNAQVEIVETKNFTVSGANVVVGLDSTDMALTPDGRNALVTDISEDQVSIVDTKTRTVTTVAVNERPRFVTVSPDGKKAYVFNQGSRSFSVIDIGRRLVTATLPLNDGSGTPAPLAEGLAISPQGDQMYLANSGSNTLSSVQFGARLPAEWQLTSGEARPICLPKPFHLVAEMGSATLPTSLSQVVPVTPSTRYELNFWAIANEPVEDAPAAVAEVLWLSDGCGLLETDSIPIEVVRDPDPAVPADLEKAALVFHRLSSRQTDGETTPLISPSGAVQAEVRFSVGKGAAARIDLASLAASSELVANGDFRSQQNGKLTDWTLLPAATPGFTVIPAEAGLQLRNAGGATAELVQTATTDSSRPFTLEFQGKIVTGATEDPRIELRWLKANGSVAAEASVLEIKVGGLDSTVMNGTVPRDASKVEIHVVVPAKTTLEVKRVSLKYLRTTSVPVTFIAEAPGDLTVSDVRVAFEEVAPKAPKIPPSGLCKTTPPGCEPGEGGDRCFCYQCEAETVMIAMLAMLTEQGRPAITGRCSICDTELLSSGGPLIEAAELALRQTLRAQPVVVHPAMTSVRELAPVTSEMRLTDIRGIGEARARQLTNMGINSVERLAAASPEDVAKIKFITPQMATQIVTEAKSRLDKS